MSKRDDKIIFPFAVSKAELMAFLFERADMGVMLPEQLPPSVNGKRVPKSHQALLPAPDKSKGSPDTPKIKGPDILRKMFLDAPDHTVDTVTMRAAYEAAGLKPASYSAQVAGLKAAGEVTSPTSGVWKATARGLANFRKKQEAKNDGA